MAAIDTNPLTPVWPQRPIRNIDPEENGSERRPRQKKDDDVDKNKSDDDGLPRIDEYA